MARFKVNIQKVVSCQSQQYLVRKYGKKISFTRKTTKNKNIK